MENNPVSAEIAALDAFGGFQGATLLEVGCGDGRLTAAMAGRVRRLVAVDPSPEALRQAAAAVDRALLCRASGEQLPFADRRFETVVFSLSLHHQNSRRALQEAARVVAPSGRILVMEPMPDGEVQQLFHLFEDETAALEAAQAAIAASPLRVIQKRVFEADWQFPHKGDFSRYMFTYHAMPRDAALEARLFRALGAKAEDRPLVLNDTLCLLRLIP
jgi:ubiquinone/menaquinone biosynthesis C-methylase UbiE